MAIEHVIIPVDFSEASLVAVEQGRALARRAGADVELLSVSSPPTTTTSRADSSTRYSSGATRCGASAATGAPPWAS
jgi:nucleotide-binding universal stress UspA family protein